MERITLDLSVGALIGYHFRGQIRYGIIHYNRIMIYNTSAFKHSCIAADEIVAVRDGLKPGNRVELTGGRSGLLQTGNVLEVNLVSKNASYDRYARRSRTTSVELSWIVKNHTLPLYNEISRVIPPDWTPENINYSVGSTVRLFQFRKNQKTSKQIIYKTVVSLVAHGKVKQYDASDVIWWENGWQVGGEVMLTNGEIRLIFSAPIAYLETPGSGGRARRYLIEDIKSN